MKTFISNGWDFAIEKKNGLNDYWDIDLTGNMEAILKECGYEDSNIGSKKKTGSKQEEILEPDPIPAYS